MKKLLIIILITLQAATLSFSQANKPVLTTQLQTGASGMSAERLSRIDATVQEYISKQWLNGAVAIIYRNGKLAYYKAYGVDDATQATRPSNTPPLHGGGHWTAFP